MKITSRVRRGLETAAHLTAVGFEIVLLVGVLALAAIMAIGIFTVRAVCQLAPRMPVQSEIKELFAMALGPFAQDVALKVLDNAREDGCESVAAAGERQLAEAGHPITNWGQKNKPEAKAAHVDANGGLQLVGADAHHDAAR